MTPALPSETDDAQDLAVLSTVASDQIGRVRWRDTWRGAGISTLVHAAVILALALCVFPVLEGAPAMSVQLRTALPIDPAALAVEVDSVSDVAFSSASSAAASTAYSAATATTLTGTLPETTHSQPLRALRPPSLAAPLPARAGAADLLQSIRPLRRSNPQAGGLVNAPSVQTALTGVLGHIRSELDQDMLQVVWMLDASISLHDDRQEVAAQLVPFYKEMLARPNKREKPFRSAVVGYAARPAVLLRSSDNPSQVVQAIANMASDPSGLENVFTAVQFAVQTFGSWKGTTIVVIWTDESGDDLPLLEDTIRLCRERNVIVHVVGPQAVLGMEAGLQHYVIPQTQQAYLVPVKRGPDAALPERLRLPYWFDSESPPWTLGGAYISRGGANWGGPLREGVLSGVGPYALTRLALETGGTFSLLQRQGDTPPLEWQTQRLYLPEYDSAREIISGLQRAPLRLAVVEAAALTWKADLHPPTRAFFGKADDHYPFRVQTPYQPPALFQGALKSQLSGHMTQAQADLQVVEYALARLSVEGLDEAYTAEEHPRWRAWFDLNRGRLLAMSVRLREYHETLRLVQQNVGLTPNTNFLSLVPSPQLKTGRVADDRAVQAGKYLRKVISEHAGTPWAQLAQWELNEALGFVVQPREIPLPKPGPPGRPGPIGSGPPTIPKL